MPGEAPLPEPRQTPRTPDCSFAHTLVCSLQAPRWGPSVLLPKRRSTTTQYPREAGQQSSTAASAASAQQAPPLRPAAGAYDAARRAPGNRAGRGFGEAVRKGHYVVCECGVECTNVAAPIGARPRLAVPLCRQTYGGTWQRGERLQRSMPHRDMGPCARTPPHLPARTAPRAEARRRPGWRPRHR